MPLSDEQLQAAYYGGIREFAETTDDDGSGWDAAGLRAVEAAVRADMQREVRTVEWEYGTSVPALGDKPGSETYPTLESALAVQRESATTYKKWTHGNPVSVWRRTPAGPWYPVTPSTPNQTGAEQ